MSKETALIILGLFIMALRTLLGVPGQWQTALLIIAGGIVAIIGFLLRGEAIARGARHHRHSAFVEHMPEASDTDHHVQNEGITSLN